MYIYIFIHNDKNGTGGQRQHWTVPKTRIYDERSDIADKILSLNSISLVRSETK